MRTILFIIFALGFGHAFAQTFTVAKTEKTAAAAAPTTLTVDGKSFTTFTGPSGSVYILRTSKDGKEYKQYLGYPTTFRYEGKTVYSDKENAEFWVLALSSNGYPKKVLLKKE